MTHAQDTPAPDAPDADTPGPTPAVYWDPVREERRMRWMDDALRYYWWFRYGAVLAAQYAECSERLINLSVARVREHPEALAYAQELLREVHSAIVHADAASYQARCAAEVALCDQIVRSAKAIGPKALSTALASLARLQAAHTPRAAQGVAGGSAGTQGEGSVTVTVPPSMMAQRPDDPTARGAPGDPDDDSAGA